MRVPQASWQGLATRWRIMGSIVGLSPVNCTIGWRRLARSTPTTLCRSHRLTGQGKPEHDLRRSHISVSAWPIMPMTDWSRANPLDRVSGSSALVSAE